MDDTPRVPRMDLESRLERLNDKLDILETRLERIVAETEAMKTQIANLESSFLDEIAHSAKTKFDNFRDYLADKIKP